MKPKARKDQSRAKPVDRERVDSDHDVPIDRLTILLRAFVEKEPKKPGKKKGNPTPIEELPPSDWKLIFDTETKTDQSQRLRFGTYQLRSRFDLREQGVFYNPEATTEKEIAVIHSVVEDMRSLAVDQRIYIMTRDEFVDDVLLGKAYPLGALIIGFNLPFDLSRLAISHGSARGRKMKGGFSLTLSKRRDYPHLRIRHLSGHSAFFDFPRTEAEVRNRNKNMSGDDKRRRLAEKGYFVDLKTASKALLSEPHSLASLSEALKVKTPKIERDDHGEEITADYVRYGIRDTQTTWECFEALSSRYSSYGLAEVLFHELFSEASLGKAYLQAMNVRPWREVQKDISGKMTGYIMSAYFGGRSEVHLRREIAQVLYCDFLSMYPTVCTLMGLWRFVISTGITPSDHTKAVRRLLNIIQPNDLCNPDIWTSLNVLVQVLPDDDVFPVRAHYPVPDSPEGETTASIGLNRLSRDRPLWFTLADCIASKIHTGKAPKVVKAIRFDPKDVQSGLRAISIAGNRAYRVEPGVNDFYKCLIELRQSVKARIPQADEDEKPSLESDQVAIKILANATSYGIFVELNVKDHDEPERMICNGWRDQPWKVVSPKYEDPGRYFHPLLGTLITGAARLMLTLAEKQALDQGLNWAFCDTDSLAISKPEGLDHKTFIERALNVCDWFKPLNPYGGPGSERGSILQVEKINYQRGNGNNRGDVAPLYCLAVSAKRYALFNRGEDGGPIIRKASGHGLGHLLEPYDDPKRPNRIKEIGVPAWQQDFWLEIIKATLDGHPDQVPLNSLPGFNLPAASRYAATSPPILSWFRGYNQKCKPSERVWPFNFLLSLQAKSVLQSASEDPFSAGGRKRMRRQPHPAAPFKKDISKAAATAFDRMSGNLIPQDWLLPLGESLVRYHLHPEAKFWGADFDQQGFLTRRRVYADAVQPIGKEADKMDDPEYIVSNDAEILYDLSPEDRARLVKAIKLAKKTYGLRDLSVAAKISHHRVNAIVRGSVVPDRILISVSNAARALETLKGDQEEQYAAALLKLREMIAVTGRTVVAQELGTDPSNLSKYLSGKRLFSSRILMHLTSLLDA